MKKILFLSIIMAFLCVYAVQAQEKSKKIEVPAAVKTAFDAKYPKAEKVTWGLEKQGEYEAEFVLNGIESSANFDAKGQFIESESEIRGSDLPQSIKVVLAKDFAGYKIGEAAKSTDAKGISTYGVEASNGKENLELSFDASGKLLKKKTAEKEENDKK